MKNTLQIEVKETINNILFSAKVLKNFKTQYFFFLGFLSSQCFELKENCWRLPWKCLDHDYDATENRVDKLRIHLAQMASL